MNLSHYFSIFYFFFFEVFLDIFLPILAQNLDPDSISVCNNSIWAIGEIAMKMGESMRPHVLGLLPALIIVMNREKGPKTLLENTGERIRFLGVL